MSAKTEQQRLEQEAGQWFVRMRGPAAADLRETFETWMSEAAHRAAYDRIAAQFDLGAQLDPADFAHVRSPAKSGASGRRPARSAPLVQWGAAVAACLVAVLTVFGLSSGLGRPMALADARYITAVGEIRTVQLAPGAVMTLDTDSVAVATSTAGHPRVRLERGRARFSLTRQARGLRVEAGPVRVAPGVSSFDLAATGPRQTDIVLIGGRISLAATGAAPVRWARLAPGQHLAVGADLAGARPQKAPSTDLAWPTGMRSFDRAPLAAVIAEANRYGAPKIRLRDPELGALRVTGAFRVTDRRALAPALAAAFGLVLTRAPGGDLVLDRQTG